MTNHDIEGWFPNLQQTSYEIASPASMEYNCVAWAAGDTQACWWPDAQNIYYWPNGVARIESLEAFETLSYRVCDSAEYEQGFEKIAIYVDASGKPTHIARQLSYRYWTSKLGQLHDIEHELEGVSGSCYGSVAVFMKKPK